MPWWWLQNSDKKFRQCHRLFVKKLIILKPRQDKNKGRGLQKKDKKFLKKSLTNPAGCGSIQSERTRKELKKMKICFDMDGTIANLYGVDGWLDNLIAEDVRPYREAEVMLNMNSLARLLNNLQKKGNEIVIISWLSKSGSDDYNEAVTETKKAWLAKHLGSVRFDEINIVKYGYCKNNFCSSENDILFDDEEQNRNAWSGKSYNVNNILEVLKNI